MRRAALLVLLVACGSPTSPVLCHIEEWRLDFAANETEWVTVDCPEIGRVHHADGGLSVIYECEVCDGD